jgi:hypothetical protein
MEDNDEDISDDSFYNKLAIINPSRIKSLTFYLFASDTSQKKDLMEKCNRLFSFVFQSCPLLEAFHIIGFIIVHGAFRLDFRHLDHLKQVKFEMQNCRYYNFYHIPGRRWKNIEKPSTEEDLTAAKKKAIHITSTWLGTPVLEITFQLNYLTVVNSKSFSTL